MVKFAELDKNYVKFEITYKDFKNINLSISDDIKHYSINNNAIAKITLSKINNKSEIKFTYKEGINNIVIILSIDKNTYYVLLEYFLFNYMIM